MLTIKHPIFMNTSYDLGQIGSPQDLVFFDIETTGFTPFSSSLYLVGAVYWEQGGWYLVQWFGDSLSSEQEILERFFQLVTTKKVLIHFNGDSFDIPYLTKCAAQYGIQTPFKRVESFDIYKKIKPLKSLLGLPNLKQKSIEQFLQLKREDLYHGGELIPIYQTYLRTQNQDLLRLLFMHNREDVLLMPQLLPLLSYLDIPGQSFSICKQELCSNELIIGIETSLCLPSSFQCTASIGRVQGDSHYLTAFLPVLCQELKYYYPDYKNYYYLPSEDEAIHKRVAQFVDKEHRIAATRSNCYIRRHDTYLPNPNPELFPAFLSQYKSSEIYTPYQDEEEFLHSYLQQFFQKLIRGKNPAR